MYGLIQKHKGIAAAIIAVASISFLFWMFTVQDIRQIFGTQRCVAQVNDTCITYREYRLELLKFSDLLQNPQTAQLIKQQIVSSMISRELVYQKAVELGILASDKEVAEAILKDETFAVEGKFNYDKYLELLNRINLTPVEYEESLKKALTIRKFANFVSYGTYVSGKESEIDRALKSIVTKGKLFILNPEDVKVKYAPSEKEIKEYYEKNKDKFKTAERKIYHLWELKDKKKAHSTYNALKEGKEAQGFKEVVLSKDKFNQELPQEVKDTLKRLTLKDRVSILKQGETYYVVQLFKIEPPREKSLEESKEDIKRILIEVKKQQELEKYARRIKEEIAKGKKPKIKSISFENTPLEQIVSLVPMGEKDIVRLIFTEERLFGPYRTSQGLAIVLIEERERKEIKDEDIKPVLKAIRDSKTQALVNLYAEKLLKKADIKVNEDYLK